MKNDKPDYIVIVAACSFPYGNASDNAIFTLMSGFNEHGCDGEVVCLYPNLQEQYKQIRPTGNYQGVKYRYLHGRTHRSSNKLINYIDYACLSYYLFKRYLKEKTRKYTIHAIFETHVSEKFFKFSKICHDLGVEVILRPCEYPEYLIEDTPQRRERFKQLSAYIDKYVFETKTLESYTAEVLQMPLQSVVVPAPMPFEDILACNKRKVEQYIAYCGSVFSESKDGLSNIIKAYYKFHQNVQNVNLRFIGRISRKDYYNELLELVKKLGLEDLVIFTGEVTREEYLDYLCNATLMMVAKPTGSYYGGGLSSKVMEYLFSGNPVIMVAADDYVHYLTHGENVFFAKDNDPETLYNSLLAMFADEDYRHSIGNNGKAYALENFNYHILTERLLPFILH